MQGHFMRRMILVWDAEFLLVIARRAICIARVDVEAIPHKIVILSFITISFKKNYILATQELALLEIVSILTKSKFKYGIHVLAFPATFFY